MSGRQRRSLTRALVLMSAGGGLIFAWGLAAPHGATPAAELVLVEIWCADQQSDHCLRVDDDRLAVPEAVVRQSCVGSDPRIGATCLNADPLPPGSLSTVAALGTDGRRITGGSAEARYARSQAGLVDGDVDASLRRIRTRNATIAGGLIAASLILAGAAARRGAVLAGILLVPLGLSLLVSVDSSAWTIAGAFAIVPAAVTFLQPGPALRRILALATAGAAALALSTPLTTAALATGPFLVGALAVAGVIALQHGSAAPLRARLGSRYLQLWTMALVLAGSSIARSFSSSRPIERQQQLAEQGVVAIRADEQGLFPGGLESPVLSAFGSLPRVLLGAFGAGEGLGRLDTPMPILAVLTLTAALGLAVVISLRAAPTANVALFAIALLAASSHAVLVALRAGWLPLVGGFSTRHFLAGLIVAMMALTVRTEDAPLLRIPPAIANALFGLLAAGHSIALHRQLRRYVNGTDGGSIVWIDTTDGWWWEIPIGPMAVWGLGSVSMIVLVAAARVLLTRAAALGPKRIGMAR
jgi:hypothetical protein